MNRKVYLVALPIKDHESFRVEIKLLDPESFIAVDGEVTTTDEAMLLLKLRYDISILDPR